MLETFFPELNECLKPYFLYRTNKYILIEVPVVGIVFRLAQLGALIYVIFSMVTGNGWAYTEVPLGQVNAWVEDGDYTAIGDSLNPYTTMVYCSNPEYAYQYSSAWVYGTPEEPPICNSPNPYTITQKTVDSVFVTTAFIENNEYGFPCANFPSDEEREAHCRARGPAYGNSSTLMQRANGQCICTGPKKTYYPLAAEEMYIAFEHFYHTNYGKKLSGASLNEDQDPPLDTTFEWANGTEKVWQAGKTVQVKLKDLLLASKHAYCEEGAASDMRDGVEDGECKRGVTLDEAPQSVERAVSVVAELLAPSSLSLSVAAFGSKSPMSKALTTQANPDQEQKDPTAPAGAEGLAVYPAFRTTGVSVTVEVKYDNLNANGQAEWDSYDVKATVTSTLQTGAWSSVGGSTTFKEYPQGEVGSETWELSSRYKQGVMVHLTSTGEIYSFDIYFFVGVVIEGLVLLSFAKTIADFFAFNCLSGGQSTVLKNKRCEKVSKKSEFAETGLKAALAAQQFQYFDKDMNGVIEAQDLVKAFAMIEKPDGSGPAMTAEQAHAIATAVMEDADTDSSSFGSLDFSEFITCADGEATSFEFFLKKLKPRTGAEDYVLRVAARTHAEP